MIGVSWVVKLHLLHMKESSCIVKRDFLYISRRSCIAKSRLLYMRAGWMGYKGEKMNKASKTKSPLAKPDVGTGYLEFPNCHTLCDELSCSKNAGKMNGREGGE